MSLTRKHCEEFLKNPSVNPKTGRKIEMGKVTHKKLMEDCKSIMKRDKAPPMGPMIHWKMSVNGTEEENMKQLVNYIKRRLLDLDKVSGNVYSQMEVNDFKGILKAALALFRDSKSKEFCNKLYAHINYIEAHDKLMDDLPKTKIVGKTEVHVDRVENRLEVFAIWNQIRKNIIYMDDTIKTKKIDLTIPKGFIRDLILGKKYLDYLIAHNIFSYDDIYKHTFTSEKVFEELASKFQIYKKIYKEVKGKSPI